MLGSAAGDGALTEQLPLLRNGELRGAQGWVSHDATWKQLWVVLQVNFTCAVPQWALRGAAEEECCCSRSKAAAGQRPQSGAVCGAGVRLIHYSHSVSTSEPAESCCMKKAIEAGGWWRQAGRRRAHNTRCRCVQDSESMCKRLSQPSQTMHTAPGGCDT